MEFDVEHNRAQALSNGDPVPPPDWSGFGQATSMEAIYNAHQPALARYLRRRAPKQDLGDLVQECFRRLAMAKGNRLALIEKPGAYLLSTARNLLTDRARADTARQASQHHSFEDEDIAGPDPHAALEARDTMRRVGEAIENLKPQTGSI